MKRIWSTAILIAAGLFVSMAQAQTQLPVPSCCAEKDAPLPPLPPDATAKERLLRRIHEEANQDKANIYLSTKYIDEMRDRLKQEAPTATLVERFGLRWSLAQALVRIGELEEAADLCKECLKLCATDPQKSKAWVPEVLFRLAATHFRQAEKQNCIARHNSESCILPLSPKAVHVDKEGAEAAVEVLERLLAMPDHDLHTDARWLLNIAHMAIGDWPDGVPAAHRIDAKVFASEVDMPRFRERGGDLGIGKHLHSGSVVIDDFTGDGRLDVLTCAFDTGKPLRLLRNDGDGGLTDIAEEAGLGRQLGGINLVQADIDNDGLMDVLVLRGGGFFAGTCMPNSLLRQDKPGHFIDVTEAAGIELSAPTRTAAFADIDRDGDLDLYIGYESMRTMGGVQYPSRLLLNDGKGHFSDITDRAGIQNADRCYGVVFADFDGDLLPDLYISNFIAPNRLFMNRGGGQFVEQSGPRGVDGPVASGPCAALDYDNDGDLDLFVGYMHHYRPIRTVAAWYIDHRIDDDTQRLFENDGKGNFRDVTEARGLKRAAVVNGLNFGDVDNDGSQDLYLTTGAHDLAALFPNVLLLGGARFRDATFAAGVGHLQKGNGVAFGDLDGDGDLDLFAQVGGAFQDDGFGSVLFENPGNKNHWLEVQLRGERDNRFGLGARLRVTCEGPDGKRDIFATVGPGGSTGCNPMRAHLGLGAAERILSLEVRWPASGETQMVREVPLDAGIVVTQGKDGCERVRSEPIRLGKK